MPTFRHYRIPISIRVPAVAIVEGESREDAAARLENILDSGNIPFVDDPDLSNWSDPAIEGDAEEDN